MPHSLRGNLSEVDVKLPGPGQYDPDGIKFRTKSPNWK